MNDIIHLYILPTVNYRYNPKDIFCNTLGSNIVIQQYDQTLIFKGQLKKVVLQLKS